MYFTDDSLFPENMQPLIITAAPFGPEWLPGDADIPVTLAGSLSGCAGGVRLSGKTMCEAHGGTYATESKQCRYPAQPPTRSALDICRMHGGEWDDVADSCTINDRSK